jgi:hypothetical protein
MGGANRQTMAKMERITRPLPPREEYALMDPMSEGATEMSQTALRQPYGMISDQEMMALQRLPLFRSTGGPSPSVSVVPPPTVPMRSAPMGVR